MTGPVFRRGAVRINAASMDFLKSSLYVCLCVMMSMSEIKRDGEL